MSNLLSKRQGRLSIPREPCALPPCWIFEMQEGNMIEVESQMVAMCSTDADSQCGLDKLASSSACSLAKFLDQWAESLFEHRFVVSLSGPAQLWKRNLPFQFTFSPPYCLLAPVRRLRFILFSFFLFFNLRFCECYETLYKKGVKKIIAELVLEVF